MAPVRGYDEATVPGTIEHRKEREYRHDGVPVGLEDLELLNQTAADLDLPPLA
jgi:hypothetical protein